MFADHSKGEEVTINPRSVLRMWIQKNEAAWMDLRFKSNCQSTWTCRKWVMEVLRVPGVADTSVEADVGKAMDISISFSVVRSHVDLGVASIPLEREDTILSTLPGESYSHVGRFGGDVPPTTICR